MSRTDLSRPVRLALEAGLISAETTVFDYGCGHGGDIRRLRKMDIDCDGWDPKHRPGCDPAPAEVVNLGYVVNVIEDPRERSATLQTAWKLAKSLLVVSARLKEEARKGDFDEYSDGCLTKLDTFQKFYDQSELRDWIDQNLQVESVAAAPGVFYVFRDEEARQAYLATRYRRRAAAPRLRRSDVLYEQHRAILEPLMAFFGDHGRLPEISELHVGADLLVAFGSIRKAFAVVRRITGPEQWDQLKRERGQDLLIYLALGRFGRRPKFSALPRTLRLDLRALFGSYKTGCATADELLYEMGKPEEIRLAVRTSKVGRDQGNALILHTTAIPSLPLILRMYEACARTYIGDVEEANIVRLHCDEPRVSYLAYPDFEKHPHPARASTLVADFGRQKIYFKSYARDPNPPVLHRKDELLPEDHALRPKFARLTAQEDRKSLHELPNAIATRSRWEEMLRSKGVYLRGHRLLRGSPS